MEKFSGSDMVTSLLNIWHLYGCGQNLHTVGPFNILTRIEKGIVSTTPFLGAHRKLL